VAQAVITALALEELNRAFVLSLAAGGLSGFYACLVQQRMTSFSLLTTVRTSLAILAVQKNATSSRNVFID
jgi:hypothetical protein